MRPVFEILKIAPTNDFSAVKGAYHKKALELHPDKNPGDSTTKEAFQQLQAAFEKVNDPEKLNHYFRTLQHPLPQATFAPPFATPKRRAEFMAEYNPYTENRRATKKSERDRINLLYKAGFPADPTKTGFVDIYVPLHFDVVEVDSTESAQEITPGLYVSEDEIDEDIVIGKALPLPTEVNAGGLRHFYQPISAKYNSDDLMQYQHAGINFANVANALTKLSAKRPLQVGCSIKEAYGIINQYNKLHYRAMIIKISIPAQSLSAQSEYEWACFNEADVPSSRHVKTLLLRRGNVIKEDQIEKTNFVPDEGYNGYCTIYIDPCDVHRNIFRSSFLGNTDALNPSYINPSQERPRSPTRTTASLFSSAAASSDAKSEDASVTPESTRR